MDGLTVIAANPNLLTPSEVAFFFVTIWGFLGFALSRILHRNDIADLLWGSGIALLTLAMGFLTSSEPLHLRQWLILLLVSGWGMRLTFFLGVRNLPEPEDSRYAAWRVEWGHKEPIIALFRVFLMQSVFAVVVGGAAWGGLLARASKAPVGLWEFFFFALALGGLTIESLADLQLYQFKKSKNRAPAEVLQSGLWAWSRHPNYFGETLFWWATAALALFSVETSLQASIVIVGVLFITFLLLKVSGVPMTERGMSSRRKSDEYARYLSSTSPFVPLPPRLYAKLK